MFSQVSGYRFRFDRSKILLVGLLLLVSFGMRIFGIDWDQGAMFHPDERAIFMKTWDLAFPLGDLRSLVDGERSTWNPKWFPYGSYLLYQLKISSEFLNISDFSDLRFVGRTLAALADTGTVFVVFLLGQRLFNFATGLVAGILTAFCVLHIQLSHFYTAEPFFTLFTLCTLWFTYKVVQGSSLRDSAFAGLFFGLAMGTKISAAPVIGVFGVACVLSMFQLTKWNVISYDVAKHRVLPALRLMGTFLMSGTLVFFIVCPYALLDFSTFIRDISEQHEMVTRSVDLPYTRQYEGTTRYLYQITQLSLWGFGLPLASFVFSGLGYSCWKLYRRPDKGLAVLLSWVIIYTILTGWFDVKFLRYMLPVAPVMILLGTYGVLRLAQDFSSVSNKISHGISWLVVLVTILTAGYAVAYLRIYTEPHTATRASVWINGNIPINSLLLSEHWEESIPGIEQYRHQKLPMYEVDNDDKLHQLSFMVSAADYILFYSDRLYGTVGRLDERYPISRGFYRKLFDGDLGYEVAHVEFAYPQFLGVNIVNDTFARPRLPVPEGVMGGSKKTFDLNFGYSDESFTVYDHPLVLIFSNEKRLSVADIESLIEVESGWAQPDGVLKDNYYLDLPGLLNLKVQPAEFSDEEKGVYQESGTWNELVMPSDRSLVLQVVLWLVLVMAIHISILPLCLTLFSVLPDRGYLLGKTLGILLICYVVWMLASLHISAFSSVTIWLTVGVVGVSVWAWALLNSRLSKDMLKDQWKQWCIGEMIFLGAFLVFLVIRMMNPDLWHPWRGGEKFMELAYLSATFKSVFMPPYDPWFAGGYMNYYYFGYFVIACLSKAIFITPALSFNLAIPLIFALVVSSSYSIGYNLAAIGDRDGTSRMGGLRLGHVVSGILTALCVAVLANLDGMIQLYEQMRHRFFEGGGWSSFDYWRSSRLMPPDPPGHEITEFPYWSLLFGDLHAHVMSIPFCLLVVGILLVIYLRGISFQLRDYVVYGTLALSCGVLWPMNAWDFPTYVALILCVFAYVTLRDNGFQKRDLIKSVAIATAVSILSVVLYLPFHQGYKGYGLGLVVSTTQTDFVQYLTIHGLFFFILLSFLFWRFGSLVGVWMNRYLTVTMGIRLPELRLQKYLFWKYGSKKYDADVIPVVSSVIYEGWDKNYQREAYAGSLQDTSLAPWVKWFLFVSSVGILSLLAFSGYFVVVSLSVLVATIIWILVRSALGAHADGAQAFALLVVAMALSLGIAVDIVTFNNDIGRMNTVFKFYEQAWVLWGIGTGFFLYTLISYWVIPRKLTKRKVGWAVVFSILFVSASIFPIFGTYARVQDRFQPLPMTLNGMAYMEVATYNDPNGPIELKNDLRAIEWMRENVKGSPVILEGRTPLYRWGGRISVYTGLPSIIGWDWHQTQQRMAFNQEVNNRGQVVDLIYNTENRNHAIDLIDYYDVRYIVVGELEGLYYQNIGLRKFDAMIGSDLDLVYQHPDVDPKVKIYYRTPQNSDS